MSKSVNIYFRHMLDEIIFLTEHSASITEDQFMRDDVLQRSFARSLEIIGEAAKHIDEETRLANPTIDWKSLAGLRDKLIHHYFGVDYAIVWDVIKNELPQAGEELKKIIV